MGVYSKATTIGFLYAVFKSASRAFYQLSQHHKIQINHVLQTIKIRDYTNNKYYKNVVLCFLRLSAQS